MKRNIVLKQKKHARRKRSVRKNIHGTLERPRVSIYRSNNHIYAQIINDDARNTLVSYSDVSIKKGTPIEKASQVGEALGNNAVKNKITHVVFDRAGYKYHGRVKALADALRKAGLSF